MSIISHVKEAWAEMANVKWPTKKQITQYTLVIIVLSLLIAAYVGALDVLFTKVLGWIIS